jgi:hypothetical protein
MGDSVIQVDAEGKTDQEVMLDALGQAAAQYERLEGALYTSPYDFVLQHGKLYRGEHGYQRYPDGAQTACYGNAIVLSARFGLKYIEGFAIAPTGSLIHHAWNAEQDGALVDSTWHNLGLVYYGVEFSVERADDATWNGDACVLNYEHRNYPLFQKPWTGEDYSIVWPPSSRLEFIRKAFEHRRPTAAGTIQELVTILSRYRFRYKNEDELQQGIAHALATAGIDFAREVRIDAQSRLDFLIGDSPDHAAGIVIETKIHANSSRAQILRQVERYALSARVLGVLVVGTKFIEALPDTINGKPLRYHCLLRSML